MFKFETTPLEGLIIVKPQVFGDERGYFLEMYKESEFKANGIVVDFIQDNLSFSTRGVLRGLHYQEAPHGQAKLVRCLEGEIYDVAVDIRPGSPTFGQHFGINLSDINNISVFVPAGFAHGFLTLSDTALMAYKCSNEYNYQADRGILWNDPDLNIQWPLQDIQLSPKDKIHPVLKSLK